MSEHDREIAEHDREIAEVGRVEAEGERVVNETGVEDGRVVAEALRVTAEGSRVKAEKHRLVAEAEGVDAMSALTGGFARTVKEVRGLRGDLLSIDERRGRELQWAKVAMALVVVLVLATAVAAVSTRPILALIESSVLPGGEINNRTAQTNRVLIQGLTQEEDCRNRRAGLGLPPPPTTIVRAPDGSLVGMSPACGDLPDSPAGFATPQDPQPIIPPKPEPPSDDDWRWWLLALIPVAAAWGWWKVRANRERSKHASRWDDPQPEP